MTATAWRVESRTRASNIFSIVAALVILLALAAPLFLSRSAVQNLFFILTMLVLAQCWNLLAGYAGLVSVGQQAFVGFGAYAMFAGVILLRLDPIAAILFSGLAAALLAIPTGYFIISPSAPGSLRKSPGWRSPKGKRSVAARGPRCPAARFATCGARRRSASCSGCAPCRQPTSFAIGWRWRWPWRRSVSSTGCCARARDLPSPRCATTRKRPAPSVSTRAALRPSSILRPPSSPDWWAP